MYKKHFSFILVVILILIAFFPQTTFAQEDWPRVISIGTASVGGMLHLVGGLLSEFWIEIGVNASVEDSGGSFHNTMLINKGDLHTALISQGAAWEAWSGEEITGLFENEAEYYHQMRGIHPLHVSQMHSWTVDDTIESYRDLDGKIVSGGPAGGTSDFWFRMVMDILGVKPARVVYTSLGDTVNLIRDNLLDLGTVSGGFPVPAANEASATLGAHIVGVKFEEDIEKIKEQMPFFSTVEIPAGAYQGLDEALLTVGDWNVYFAHKDLPEEMVYQYTKSVFENLDRLYEGHASLKTVTADSVKNIVLPLHRGAYRYYNEAGIEVHPDAIPVD